MIGIIIGVVVGFILLLIILLSFSGNKYKYAIIKIDRAEEDIDIYLQKKKDYLDRTRPIIKKELKLNDFLGEIDSNIEEMSNHQKNDFLRSLYNELFKTIDENEKLLKSDTLMSIIDDLNDNEEQIIGCIKYYNDTVVDFNRLVISFPTNIIALFRGYKKKEFYNNEKREMFEILNEK